jgi:NitT/TauT family transport system substrate-binding protein
MKVGRIGIPRRRILEMAAAGTAGATVAALVGGLATLPAIAASPSPGASAATSSAALQKVTFQTAFGLIPTAAPWFMARDRGHFAANGLDVEIVPGTGSSTAARIVGAGTADFGEVDGGVIFQAVGRGIPIKAVFGYLQTSPSGVIVRRDSGMTRPKDLEGKTLAGTNGGASEVLFPGWMRLNGGDPNKVKIEFLMAAARDAAFIQGKTQGTFSFTTGGLQIIRAAGVDAVPIRFSDFGFNIPGNALVANAATIKNRPDLVTAFVTAAQKGLEDTIKDPQAAIDVLLKAAPQNRAVAADILGEALRLHASKRTEGKPVGWISTEDWRDAIEILQKYGGLTEVPKVEDVVANFVR